MFIERNGAGYSVIVDPSVAKVRPYTACAVVKDLRFNDERIRDAVLLQEKLVATLGRKVKRFGLGLYPLKAIAFPVRSAIRPWIRRRSDMCLWVSIRRWMLLRYWRSIRKGSNTALDQRVQEIPSLHGCQPEDNVLNPHSQLG